jgi:hypothetical protein
MLNYSVLFAENVVSDCLLFKEREIPSPVNNLNIQFIDNSSVYLKGPSGQIVSA